MNVTTEQAGGVSIVRVGETRLMYPMLCRFLVGGQRRSSPRGQREILIDLTPVTYVDSATIGCLMDLYRQVHAAGGHLKLSGVQKRVETMLTMTGAQNFIEIHADEPTRRQELRGIAMRTIKTTTGADDHARRRSARRHGSALPAK